MKTNPAYAELAYKKALLGEAIDHFGRFTEALGLPARGEVHSEDLIRSDSKVPENVVNSFIVDLRQQRETVMLEMARFDFVKRESNDQEQQQTQRKSPSKKKATRKRRPRKG